LELKIICQNGHIWIAGNIKKCPNCQTLKLYPIDVAWSVANRFLIVVNEKSENTQEIKRYSGLISLWTIEKVINSIKHHFNSSKTRYSIKITPTKNKRKENVRGKFIVSIQNVKGLKIDSEISYQNLIIGIKSKYIGSSKINPFFEKYLYEVDYTVQGLVNTLKSSHKLVRKTKSLVKKKLKENNPSVEFLHFKLGDLVKPSFEIGYEDPWVMFDG